MQVQVQVQVCLSALLLICVLRCPCLCSNAPRFTRAARRSLVLDAQAHLSTFTDGMRERVEKPLKTVLNGMKDGDGKQRFQRALDRLHGREGLAASLQRADLQHASFEEAKLMHVNLTSAKLFNASFDGADLTGAVLTLEGKECFDVGANLYY